MRNRFSLAAGALALAVVAASTANATTCAYFLGYVKSETERPYALKKVYRYTPERLSAIRKFRDAGRELCRAGKNEEGVEALLKAVKLINFTRLR